MSLNEATFANLSIILNELAERLDVANPGLFDPEDYDLEKYSDLKFLYQIVVDKGGLSALESQAFVDELASIRKK